MSAQVSAALPLKPLPSSSTAQMQFPPVPAPTAPAPAAYVNLATSSSAPTYACQYPGCNKRFFCFNSVQEHAVTHELSRQHQCGSCGRSFKRKHDCIRHERTHTNERPFQCLNCGKRWTRKDGMMKHLRDPNNRVCREFFEKNHSLDKLGVPTVSLRKQAAIGRARSSSASSSSGLPPLQPAPTSTAATAAPQFVPVAAVPWANNVARAQLAPAVAAMPTAAYPLAAPAAPLPQSYGQQQQQLNNNPLDANTVDLAMFQDFMYGQPRASSIVSSTASNQSAASLSPTASPIIQNLNMGLSGNTNTSADDADFFDFFDRQFGQLPYNTDSTQQALLPAEQCGNLLGLMTCDPLPTDGQTTSRRGSVSSMASDHSDSSSAISSSISSVYSDQGGAATPILRNHALSAAFGVVDAPMSSSTAPLVDHIAAAAAYPTPQPQVLRNSTASGPTYQPGSLNVLEYGFGDGLTLPLGSLQRPSVPSKLPLSLSALPRFDPTLALASSSPGLQTFKSNVMPLDFTKNPFGYVSTPKPPSDGLLSPSIYINFSPELSGTNNVFVDA
ncbi:hypothetical protein RI367_001308 [Sorochytrium milnesiophthora]